MINLDVFKSEKLNSKSLIEDLENSTVESEKLNSKSLIEDLENSTETLSEDELSVIAGGGRAIGGGSYTDI